jgi:hypothetical protein
VATTGSKAAERGLIIIWERSMAIRVLSASADPTLRHSRELLLPHHGCEVKTTLSKSHASTANSIRGSARRESEERILSLFLQSFASASSVLEASPTSQISCESRTTILVRPTLLWVQQRGSKCARCGTDHLTERQWKAVEGQIPLIARKSGTFFGACSTMKAYVAARTYSETFNAKECCKDSAEQTGPWTPRVASVTEDPANRRVNGGGVESIVLQLFPIFPPSTP